MEDQRIVRRAVLAFFGGGCFVFLLVCCYRPVLFEDGQFAYRDAAAFYYPLYLRVQQGVALAAGRSGTPSRTAREPLLGNPMAWTPWGRDRSPAAAGAAAGRGRARAWSSRRRYSAATPKQPS